MDNPGQERERERQKKTVIRERERVIGKETEKKDKHNNH